MRVASEDSCAPTATVGLWIDTGSRLGYSVRYLNFFSHILIIVFCLIPIMVSYVITIYIIH